MRLLVAVLLAQAVSVPVLMERGKAARLGTFRPAHPVEPCHCDVLTPTVRAGDVIVLSPDGAHLPDRDVVVVQPWLGLAVPAHVKAGKIALGYFLADARDEDD